MVSGWAVIVAYFSTEKDTWAIQGQSLLPLSHKPFVYIFTLGPFSLIIERVALAAIFLSRLNRWAPKGNRCQPRLLHVVTKLERKTENDMQKSFPRL